MKTDTITLSNNRGEKGRPTTSQKAKLFITLKKSPDFEVSMQKFNESRQQKEKKGDAPAEGEEEAKQWPYTATS